jgi:ribonuclease HII
MSPHTSPTLDYEQALWHQGLTRLAGIDEAGRGAWAGPVAAAAVVLPVDPSLLDTLCGVRDSKQMTARQRSLWAERIRSVAFGWGVGMASCTEIDTLGIAPATRLAMQRALAALLSRPEHLLIDAVKLPEVDILQTVLVRGDSQVLSIAAASVLAKTARDALMIEMESEFPGYGFAHHKGYGTSVHRYALQTLRPCPQHRLSFAPLRLLSEQDRTTKI